MFNNIMRKAKFYNGCPILYATTLVLAIIVFVVVNVNQIENLEDKNNIYKMQGTTLKKFKNPVKKVRYAFQTLYTTNTKKTGIILTKNDAYIKYDKFIRHAQMVDEFISEFTILPSKKCHEDTKLVILVNSKAGGKTERTRIRSHIKFHKNVNLFFLVGRQTKRQIGSGDLNAHKEFFKPTNSQNVHSNSSSLWSNAILADEAELEGDIIVLNLVDNYNSLTVKIGSGFLWVLTYCAQSVHVLKMDDDVFINNKLLEETLKNQQPYSILGKVCTNCIPFNPDVAEESENLIRHSFVLTRNHLPLSQLPPFAFGPAYVVPTTLLPALLVTALELDVLPYYEDVFWTGLTTADLKMNTKEDGFNLLNKIALLKLQNRNRKNIVELLKFLEIICSQPNSKFAVSASSLSLLNLVDLPSWRVELRRCLKGSHCSNYTTLHGVKWKDKAVSHIIRSL